MEGTRDRLSAIGLSDGRINLLTTKDSLKPVCQKLVALLDACDVQSASVTVGTLLDELVTKLDDPEHLKLVGKFVVEGKISRPQLLAAVKYVEVDGTNLPSGI
eukprot:TRINITY_DN2781_c0_g1_i5.p1 TRINITY_DN2781_c0_g1~~TRINITY_DN2781_c0_g1_i5.p1  ORF type:complete len:103 (-),score=15.98 TRINITY_DN2781_c0_g1_i5:374-682(-)